MFPSDNGPDERPDHDPDVCGLEEEPCAGAGRWYIPCPACRWDYAHDPVAWRAECERLKRASEGEGPACSGPRLYEPVHTWEDDDDCAIECDGTEDN